MVENLKTTHYRNGDAIANPTADSRWANLTTGAYCNYNNSDSIAQKFGRLYNFYAVTDSRNIAPAGWHVPTSAEAVIFSNYIGVLYNHGSFGYLSGPQIMATTEWIIPDSNLDKPDNATGFSALPNGSFVPDATGNWKFTNLHKSFSTWINDEYGVLASDMSIEASTSIFSLSGLCKKSAGLGIRLIKD